MEIILFFIFIAVGLLAWYYEERKKSHEMEISSLKASFKETQRLEKLEILEKKALQQQEDCINLFKILYGCDDISAENMYHILKDVSMVDSFLDLQQNDDSRKSTFEFAKILKKSKEDFKNYFETTILPIIEKNSYNITFEDIEWHKDILSSRPEISLKTKLLQIHHKECMNINILYDALTSLYLSPIDVFFIGNTQKISDTHIIAVSKCYNSYFNMNFKDRQYKLLCNIYHNFDYRRQYEYFLDIEFLKNLFIACIFVMELIPLNLYNDERLNAGENEIAFSQFIRDLFFFRPYFDIKDYKEIILSHLDELKENQDGWAS